MRCAVIERSNNWQSLYILSPAIIAQLITLSAATVRMYERAYNESQESLNFNHPSCKTPQKVFAIYCRVTEMYITVEPS